MIEINLIPDVKQELLRAQRSRTMVITGSIFASIVAAGVVVLLLLYVFGVQTVRSNVLDDDIKKGAANLSQVEDLSEMLTIQNQLKKIAELDSQKIYHRACLICCLPLLLRATMRHSILRYLLIQMKPLFFLKVKQGHTTLWRCSRKHLLMQ